MSEQNNEINERKLLVLKQFLPFWNDISQIEKDTFLENAVFVKHSKGERIHAADENCLGVLLITKGVFCTCIMSDEGREITLYRLNEGDVCILSASCILSQITFDVHIEVEEDCEALLINSSVYSNLASKNALIDNFTYKLTTDRFSDVMWAMQQILFMGFDKRLAIFLNDEAALTKSDTLNLTHEQIAKHTGSAREVVTRMLRRFADDKIVELSRGEIKIIDKAKLKKVIYS